MLYSSYHVHPLLAVYFGSPFDRFPAFHTLMSVGRKSFQCAFKMFLLFCTIVKFYSTNRLFTDYYLFSTSVRYLLSRKLSIHVNEAPHLWY